MPCRSIVVGTILIFLALPAVQATASGSPPGIGSNVKAWKHAYATDHGPGQVCSAKNSCFGARLRNSDSERTYEFTNVSVTGGVIDGYDQSFPNGTPRSVVLEEIERTLPRDAVVSPVTVGSGGRNVRLDYGDESHSDQRVGNAQGR